MPLYMDINNNVDLSYYSKEFTEQLLSSDKTKIETKQW